LCNKRETRGGGRGEKRETLPSTTEVSFHSQEKLIGTNKERGSPTKTRQEERGGIFRRNVDVKSSGGGRAVENGKLFALTRDQKELKGKKNIRKCR